MRRVTIVGFACGAVVLFWRIKKQIFLCLNWLVLNLRNRIPLYLVFIEFFKERVIEFFRLFRRGESYELQFLIYLCFVATMGIILLLRVKLLGFHLFFPPFLLIRIRVLPLNIVKFIKLLQLILLKSILLLLTLLFDLIVFEMIR